MGNIRPAGVYTRRQTLLIAGAAFAVRAQSQEKGKNVAHPVVYFEIGCKDLGKTEQFFGSLFGWKMQRDGIASEINTGSAEGIPGHMVALGHEPSHYTMFYVEVEDVKAYLDKAVELGGKVLVPPIKIPTGTFAWFSDPEGNMIGLTKRG